MRPIDANTVPVAEADSITLSRIQDQVATAIMLVVDPSPSRADIAAEIAAVFLEPDSAFKDWPLSNARGQQSTFIQALTETVLARLMRPVQMDEDVAAAYIGANLALPELDQNTPTGPSEIVAEEQDPEG